MQGVQWIDGVNGMKERVRESECEKSRVNKEEQGFLERDESKEKKEKKDKKDKGQEKERAGVRGRGLSEKGK